MDTSTFVQDKPGAKLLTAWFMDNCFLPTEPQIPGYAGKCFHLFMTCLLEIYNELEYNSYYIHMFSTLFCCCVSIRKRKTERLAVISYRFSLTCLKNKETNRNVKQ